MRIRRGRFSYLTVRAYIQVISLSCNCRDDGKLKYQTVVGTISIKQTARIGCGITFNEKFKARFDTHLSKLVMKSILSQYKGMDWMTHKGILNPMIIILFGLCKLKQYKNHI